MLATDNASVEDGLDQNVEDLAFIINSAHRYICRPAIVTKTSSRSHCPVGVGRMARRRRAIDRTEIGHPSADNLIGDGYPALSEKILDIPEAECVSQIQSDGILDDHRRKAIAPVAEGFHRTTLPAVTWPGHGQP